MGNCMSCRKKPESYNSLIQNRDIYCLNCKTFIKRKKYEKHSTKCYKRTYLGSTIYDIDMSHIQLPCT